MCNKVSVIVPAYNVSLYISECIESIISQTYKNIELLIINDGSTDDTIERCKKYIINDSRITLINTENRGVSHARNIGLSMATGQFLMFVDGDDWIEQTAIEELMNSISKESADICFSNRYYKDVDRIEISTKISSNKVYSALDVLNRHIKCEFISSSCFSLFRADIVTNCKFKTDIHTLEDWEFNFQILAKAEKVYITDNAYYHYRTVSGSASNSPLNGKKISALMIYDSVNNYIESDIHLKGLDTIYISYYLIHHLSVIYAVNGSVKKAHVSLKQFCRKHIVKILVSKDLSIRQKNISFIASISLKLFGMLFRMKYRDEKY